ncbi:MAG: hypothetical protein MK100_05060 [Phycisphaerales bacterium]|nr:hypothetical protein [Phycisphaerales bacterium]
MAQQFAITPRETASAPNLGTRDEVVTSLAVLNTAAEQPGEDVLWGPGIRVDMTPGQDPVTQMLLTVVEEEIAGLAIMRIGRICKWRIIDLETMVEIEPD